MEAPRRATARVLGLGRRNDKVWLTDFAANAIVRFDPGTERFEHFPSTARGAAVRQMLGRKGEAWGAESGADRLVVVEH